MPHGFAADGLQDPCEGSHQSHSTRKENKIPLFWKIENGSIVVATIAEEWEVFQGTGKLRPSH